MIFIENLRNADHKTLRYVADGCSTNGKEVFGSYEQHNSTAGTRCCSLDGQTCTTPENCGNTKRNFEASSTICTSKIQRLCTEQELLTGVCCGTGGSCDNHGVWTSTTSKGNFCDSKQIE